MSNLLANRTSIGRAAFLTALLTSTFACTAKEPATQNASETRDPHTEIAMNFRQVDERISTGGHFVGDGDKSVQLSGITVVIDLRDEPPEGQNERLAELGIQWINIPVVWTSPQVGDFEKFRSAMKMHSDAKVMVQCQANYRASAMTYLYRVLEEGVDEETAAASMNEVWTPEGTWKTFIEDVKAATQ